MLVITEHIYRGKERVHQWRVGEPLPEITARLVVFEAYGPELRSILQALRDSKDIGK